MSIPPSLPPVLPPPPAEGAPSPKSKNTVPCVLLGCGALLLMGIFVAVVAAYWYFSAKKGSGESFNREEGSQAESGVSSRSSSAQSGAAKLGFGTKLSQYELAGGSACVVTPDGAWHAIFQEKSAYGKPLFIYHRISRDGGLTWSTAENISNDNTGNGAGFPKLTRDAQGNVYAAWIRFGQTGGYAVPEVTLDGPGGYEQGTLTLRRWSAGKWEAAMSLGTVEKVSSFCLYNGTDGSAQLLWVDEGGMVGTAPAAGGPGKVVAAAGAIPGAATNKFGSCLSALVDNQGNVFFTGQRVLDGLGQLFLWAGGQDHVLAQDPKYNSRNYFNHPAQMFADRQGHVHVIYLPHPQLTEHTELWDIDPVAGTHQVLYTGRGGKETIKAFQMAAQNGVAHVVMEWTSEPPIVAQSTELVALSFDGARWSAARGLTGNSRAEKFFARDLPQSGDMALTTRYHAQHASLALDSAGKVFLLGTIEALSIFDSSNLQRIGGTNYRVTSGGSVGNPSVYVIKWR